MAAAAWRWFLLGWLCIRLLSPYQRSAPTIRQRTVSWPTRQGHAPGHATRSRCSSSRRLRYAADAGPAAAGVMQELAAPAWLHHEQAVTWGGWEAHGFFASATDGDHDWSQCDSSASGFDRLPGADQPPRAQADLGASPLYRGPSSSPDGAGLRQRRRQPTAAPAAASGRVLDLAGRPVADAVVNVWQSDERGLKRMLQPRA